MAEPMQGLMAFQYHHSTYHSNEQNLKLQLSLNHAFKQYLFCKIIFKMPESTGETKMVAVLSQCQMINRRKLQAPSPITSPYQANLYHDGGLQTQKMVKYSLVII